MKPFKLISLCLIFIGLTSCNFPSLTPPEDYWIFKMVTDQIRSQNATTSATGDEGSTEPVAEVSATQFSITYNTVTYNPGSRIELGTGQAGVQQTFTATFLNSGTNSLQFKDADPYGITTTSTGSIQIQPVGDFPNIWEPGQSIEMNIIVTPDSQSENLWQLAFHIIEPEIVDINFSFAMFVTAPTRGDMIFFSALSPTTSLRGVFKIDFDRTTAGIGTPLKIGEGFGAACYSQSMVYSDDRKFIYHLSSTADSIVGGSLKLDGTYDPIPGSPFPMPPYYEIHPIPNQNKILAYRDLSGTAYTYNVNPTSGALENQVGFGFMCAGSRVWASQDGSYVYGGPNVSTQDLGMYSVNPAGGLNQIAIVNDPNAIYGHTIHLKSVTKPYVYSATNVDVPGVDNLKIDALLRRTLDGTGFPGNVDMEFPINRAGARYFHFIAHPNDKFYYLLGTISNTQAVIHKVIHDPNTGTLTPDATPIQPTDVNLYLTPSISPDGKYLLALGSMATVGGCTMATYHHKIHIYEIDQNTGSLTLKTDITRCSDKPTAMWGYKP